MKATFNIVGRISRVPELKSSNDGSKTYSRISVEIENEKDNKKTYFTITVWDKMAKKFVDEFSDKEMIEISGTMYVKAVENKNNYKEYHPVLNATELKKIKSSKKENKSQAKEEKEEAQEDSSLDKLSDDFDTMLSEDKSDE